MVPSNSPFSRGVFLVEIESFLVGKGTGPKIFTPVFATTFLIWLITLLSFLGSLNSSEFVHVAYILTPI